MNKIGPKLIYDHLCKKVVGQDQAKKVIATSMFMHFVNTARFCLSGEVGPKVNTLLMGPSGSGKTLLIREAINSVAELSGYNMAPAVEVDCTGLSSKGWQGDDLEDFLIDHYKTNRNDTWALASTVVFLDEVDKLCLKAVGSGGTDHNKTTQYSLLKLVEGHKIPVGHGEVFDTSTVMFVFAGNFAQIRHLLKEEGKSIGFKDTSGKKTVDLHQQLDKGGMVTQLVGRITGVGVLDPLDKKSLMTILKEFVYPDFRASLDFVGQDATLSDYQLKSVVEQAMKEGTGARGLGSALMVRLQSKLYEMEVDCPEAKEESYEIIDLTDKRDEE